MCAFLKIIFVFSIFIYLIEHGLSNNFILINSSGLPCVEQVKKLALSLIYTDQTIQIIQMVSKCKSNVIDVFYFMSTSEMAKRGTYTGHDFFFLTPIDQTRSVNCTLFFRNKNVICYSSFSFCKFFYQIYFLSNLFFFKFICYLLFLK